MKIVLATWFPQDPDAPRGGVETVSVNLAKALAAVPGNEIHVVTFQRELQKARSVDWTGVRVHRLPQPSGPLLEFAKGPGRAAVHGMIRDLKPDLVHAHDTFGIMTRGLEFPRVFTIHGFIHEDTRLRGGIKARLRSLLWKREELASWAEQPHIISISPYVRERLRGLTSGVIYDIENPVDAKLFETARSEADNVIFSAAVIARRKNQLALARAVAGLPTDVNVDLRIAGPAVETDYCDALRKFAESAESRGRVRLLGSLPSQEIRDQLSKSAVFALLSLEEGAPMGIAEAMAAGVPVLTSNRCGMPYMIRDGESGFLIDPHDIGQTAERVLRVMRDAGLRHRMGQAGKAKALADFHPQRVAKRTMDVYERAVG